MKPKIEDILDALSNEHSIKIFKQTSTGLKSGKNGIKKTGLTKKQFYNRLNRLINLGLVSKTKGIYKHTSLGTIVNSTQIKPLEEALIDYWNLRAIDELKNSKNIPLQEQEKIAKSIINKNKLNEYSLQNENQPSKIMNTYNELMKEVLRLISLAENEIFIASRYYEPNVSLKLMEKFRECVTLNILDGNPSGTSLTSRLKSALNDPSMRIIAKDMLDSNKVRIKNKILNYSFIVVDGNYCGFEIIDPLNPHEFNIAAEFKDHRVSQKMINLFENLWASSEEPIKNPASNKQQ